MPGGSVVEQWEVVLSSLRRRMTEQRFATWFRPIEPRRLDRENLTLEVPNPFFIDWFEEHNLPDSPGSGSGVPRVEPKIEFTVRRTTGSCSSGASRRPHSGVVAASACPSKRRVESSNLNPRFSFDEFRRRPEQRARPRRLPGGREGSGPRLQPSLHLRRRRPWKDPSCRRSGLSVRGSQSRRPGSLRRRRDLHERDDRGDPSRNHDGVSRSLPEPRSPPDRRHPVPLGKGPNGGGVLPHVQQPLRRQASRWW